MTESMIHTAGRVAESFDCRVVGTLLRIWLDDVEIKFHLSSTAKKLKRWAWKAMKEEESFFICWQLGEW
ncbi:hypothetical protein IF2G_08066 [Cordyceps javanica]|nr:hypothetical protein IF2G_08066 [Cordyceps javanica]